MLQETRNKVYIYGIQAMFVVILCGECSVSNVLFIYIRIMLPGCSEYNC